MKSVNSIEIGATAFSLFFEISLLLFFSSWLLVTFWLSAICVKRFYVSRNRLNLRRLIGTSMLTAGAFLAFWSGVCFLNFAVYGGFPEPEPRADGKHYVTNKGHSVLIGKDSWEYLIKLQHYYSDYHYLGFVVLTFAGWRVVAGRPKGEITPTVTLQ